MDEEEEKEEEEMGSDITEPEEDFRFDDDAYDDPDKDH